MLVSTGAVTSDRLESPSIKHQAHNVYHWLWQVGLWVDDAVILELLVCVGFKIGVFLCILLAVPVNISMKAVKEFQ
jgi:hypothetical protein